MPFLRFTRDKRGYETTSLVHAGQRGRARQRILYWFRTPPGVKVGRPALDEAAIRWIEEHNRDIEFDWQKILEAQPPPAPAADDGRNRRVRRDTRGKTERPARDSRRRQSPPPPRPAKAEAESAPLGTPDDEQPADAPQTLHPAEASGEPAAIEELTHPDAETPLPPPLNAVDEGTGREQLTRLRARYAELLARIAERGGDAARIEELRGQAEALNPDTWLTQEDVRKGLEEFESKNRDLRAALGLRKRRRSRRGGRRRRKAGPETAAAPGSEQAAAMPDTSNSEGAQATLDEDAEDDEDEGESSSEEGE